jgi:predicted helicase
MSSFENIIQKYRDTSFSERDKGYRFERLMQSFLKTYPLYGSEFTDVWLWKEFPSNKDFGAGEKDLGVDLVTRTKYGDYWAVQCKCYQEDAAIDKPKVDTFLSTSGKSFYDTREAGKKVNFAYRLWIDTTQKGFNREAESAVQNQTPQVGRIGYYDLLQAPVDWQKLDKGISGGKAASKKYDPKPHQQKAIDDVHRYFQTQDRGKLMADTLPDYNSLDAGTQCFPLYWYEKKEHAQGSLFENAEDAYIRHDAVSDFILEQAQSRYGHRVEKEDFFYYVYGILHSPEYRKTFVNDLKKMLPRLPLVEKTADFWSFSKVGRELAGLHLNYEEQKPPKEVKVTGTDKGDFTVNKMNFPSKGQKDTIIYNTHITISNIPAKAYEYIVNGKSAIEWIMERYAITTHKESGIKNDPNDWAKEHNNPRYILDLLLSVITVSVKTVDIVEGLPNILLEKVYNVNKDII